MSNNKTVFSAIIGIPNVGKSTLINRLVGARIAIATPKPQTTRNRIMGVITFDGVQYVFSDTPGMHIPKNRLGSHMQQEIYDSVDGIDVILFTIYPKNYLNDEEKKLLSDLENSRTPVILVMNKSDIVESKSKAKQMVEKIGTEFKFSDSIIVSALTGEGIEELFNLVAKYAKTGDFMYDEDTLTDQPERVIVAELIREQLIMHLSDELPYGTAVTVETFKERENGSIIDINATILCEKQSHKGIIIGKGGSMLKKIATDARIEIEDFLDSKVNLKCWVKVRDKWRDNEQFIQEYNYYKR